VAASSVADQASAEAVRADVHPVEAPAGAPRVAAAPAVAVAVVVAAPAVVAVAAAQVVAVAALAAAAAAAQAVAAPAAVAVAVEEQVAAAPEAESAARYSAVAEADRPDRPGHDVPRGARLARSSLAPLWPAACPTVVEMPVARLPQAAAAAE
jgi:hypothetical protein